MHSVLLLHNYVSLLASMSIAIGYRELETRDIREVVIAQLA